MSRYLAVLGRQPLISIAELEALFDKVKPIAPELAEFESETLPDINRLGGTLKIASEITMPLPVFLKTIPDNGKTIIGVSDYTPKASAYGAQKIALRLKYLMKKQGRSVRVAPNKEAVLSSATSFHNHLTNPKNAELIKYQKRYFRVMQIQDIKSYGLRDQARPARDAKVGMLPPKLAQILINLCGRLPQGARLLDPFCGTGVVLQEGALMGYVPYGTDLSERMVKYTEKNLEWLKNDETTPVLDKAQVEAGDATDFDWQEPIDLVACETYLGPPMSLAPAEIRLKEVKQECKQIILGFLKNLQEQIQPQTPVVIAVPAWLRPDGHYETLNLLDEIKNLRYNVHKFSNLGQSDLIYHRSGQVVAREIIVLRKI